MLLELALVVALFLHPPSGVIGDASQTQSPTSLAPWALAAVVNIQTAAANEPLMTGRDLERFCGRSAPLATQQQCYSYIVGAIDAWSVIEAGKTKPRCVADYRPGPMMDALFGYLKKHPEDRKAPGAIVVRKLMKAQRRC